MTSAIADRGNVGSLTRSQVQCFEARWGRAPSSTHDVNIALTYPNKSSVNFIKSLKASGYYHAFNSQTATTAKKPASGGGGGGGDLMSLIHQAGFTGNAANIMYGIVMAESGGSATAHNTNAGTGDNSYGLAQINMLGSMGPARLREYGLSSNDDLFDPLTNLKVAYKMSGGGTHFGDWSTYNSGAYQQYMGQSGAQVKNGGHVSSGGDSASVGGAGGSGTTIEDYEAVNSLGNLLKSVPELNTLLQQAQSGDWSTAKFENAVENSAWWKTHSQTARAMIVQKANDPASYQQTLNNTTNAIKSLAHQLGMGLTPDQLSAIASTAMLTGNDSNQAWLSQQIASKERYGGLTSTKNLQGGMAATAQQLQTMASDYGYTWTPAQLAQKAQAILAGTTTIDTYKQNLITWAKSAFPGFAKQIDDGTTLKDLAAPYVTSMSNLLEVDPASLDLYNPTIRKALQGTSAKPGDVPTAQPLWQFEDQLRKDPRWAYTDNAHATMATTALQLGQTWGFNG